MAATAQTIEKVTPPRTGWMVWTGRVLTTLVVLMMLLSASMKLSHAPAFMEQWTGKFGYPEGLVSGIAFLEIACAVVYAVPRTAVLGAILLTGYLGGAVATHVRIVDPSALTPAIVGMVAWAALYLRDTKLRSLLPLRKAS